MKCSEAFVWAACGMAISVARTAPSITTDPGELARVEAAHGGMIEHCDETVAGDDFLEIFECGDELFGVTFNATDGVGGHVGDGGRFSRSPRADRVGLGEWAAHVPARATGPNASACATCHVGAALGGAGDGSGPVGLNVIRDPFHTGEPGQFIQRNTPHLFGPGGVQLLAEEMTLALRRQRDAAAGQACAGGGSFAVDLAAKGVGFGSIVVDCSGVVDDSGVEGVDPDLLVRPFQWKGTEVSVRSFSRGAEHNELGLQPVEITGDGVDGDGDGVVDEITIADMTAMAVYLAGQPRPVSELELNRLRIELALAGEHALLAALALPVLSREEVGAIRRGEEAFVGIGCAECHRPALVVERPIFSEPSRVAGYADDPFPAGQPRLSQAIRFDLTRDLPDNRFKVGRRRFDLGNFERTRSGGAIVRLYGDLKRHDMGPGLAESIDETGHGASVWLTKELWGVGSTGEFLHDGRATTLTEAILEHGGEAAASRAAFDGLSDAEAADVVRFLESLVLFFPELAAEEGSATSLESSNTHRSRR